MVARSRGARICNAAKAWYAMRDWEIAFDALDDVAKWAGFPDRYAYIKATTGKNAKHGRKLFAELEVDL